MMAAPEDTHFTAIVEIKKVFGRESTGVTRGTDGKRIDEVTRIVIRDTNLDRLKERLGQHIALVEEGI